MTSNKAKLVNAPLNINDMDEDLESKTVYVFDYSKSSLQGLDFLNYIKNTSVVSDIFISADVPTFTKNTLLESYMKSSTFYHITSFNLTILNMIYIIKKSKKRITCTFFSEEESNQFINTYSDLLNEWINVYDSLFAYMLILSSMNKNDIFNNDKIRSFYDADKINNNSSLSPNVMSLLLDDVFYYYYEDGINRSNVSYYKKYFEEKLYDNKSLQMILLNDANFIFKILYDMVHNDEFSKYLENHPNLK